MGRRAHARTRAASAWPIAGLTVDRVGREAEADGVPGPKSLTDTRIWGYAPTSTVSAGRRPIYWASRGSSRVGRFGVPEDARRAHGARAVGHGPHWLPDSPDLRVRHMDFVTATFVGPRGDL